MGTIEFRASVEVLYEQEETGWLQLTGLGARSKVYSVAFYRVVHHRKAHCWENWPHICCEVLSCCTLHIYNLQHLPRIRGPEWAWSLGVPAEVF